MSRAVNSNALLRRLLEAAGYHLYDRPVGLVGLRGRDRRVIAIVPASPSPTEVEQEFPPEALHRIIVYTDDPGAQARTIAAERGIEILDALTLGPALGEILLSPPLGEHSADPGPQGLIAPTTVLPGGERTVRPRLSRSDAEAMAGLDDYRCTLRLVPFFVAAYQVRTVSPHGGTGSVTNHLVAINALSGRVDIWEAGDRELVAELDEPHQRLMAQLTETEARQLAEPELRRHHSVNLDHTEQHGGALIIETRRVPPGPDDLKVGTWTLVHAPFWYVEGSRGRVILDAVTGQRYGPELTSPSLS